MSRGTPALIGWLTVVTLVLILVFALILTIFGLRPAPARTQDFWDRLFCNLLHALDPGTIGGDVGSTWRFLLTMLVLTIAGLFIVSALIGVIAAGIDDQARRPAPRPVAGPRARPHRDPRLVGLDLHHHLAS